MRGLKKTNKKENRCLVVTSLWSLVMGWEPVAALIDGPTVRGYFSFMKSPRSAPLHYRAARCGGAPYSCVFAPSLSRGCQKSNQLLILYFFPPSPLLFIHKVKPTTDHPTWFSYLQSKTMPPFWRNPNDCPSLIAPLLLLVCFSNNKTSVVPATFWIINWIKQRRKDKTTFYKISLMLIQ